MRQEGDKTAAAPVSGELLQTLPKHCVHEFAHHFDAVMISKNQELLDLKNQKIKSTLERLEEGISEDSVYRQQLESVIADARKRRSLYLTAIADLMAAIC